MDFTGERFIPDAKIIHAFGHEMAAEHFHRYILASSLVENKDVLDIASGEGYGSFLLSQKAMSVIGVDISNEAVDNARKKYIADNLCFRQGDAACIPLAANSVDVVVSFETIEHHSRHEEMMREIVRVLRPNGLLCISSPNKETSGDIVPPNSNPFHVKELYKGEFDELITRHFKFHRFFDQEISCGSFIIPENDEDCHFSLLKYDDSYGYNRNSYFSSPKYFIVLASDSEDLPDFQRSLFKINPEDSEASRLLIDSLQNKYNELQNRVEQYERLAEQRELVIRTMTCSRSWRITAPLRFLAHQLRVVRDYVKKYLYKNKNIEIQAAIEKTPHSKPIVALFSGEPQTPGHRYRIERLAVALRPRYQANIYAAPLRDEDISTLMEADVLWVWRAAITPELELVLKRFKNAGKKIIFDIDDRCFHPDHFSKKLMDAIRFQNISDKVLVLYGQNMFKTMGMADVCSLATKTLATEVYAITGKPTFVLPNTFDREFAICAMEARKKAIKEKQDPFVRIGYAAGSPTHQADFKLVVPALAAILERHVDVRLVLFNAMIDLGEFPELSHFAHQVEWRDTVPLCDLPNEIARFDINIAPLEVDNVFCDCKSELKFFEAALSEVPSIVSPTQPMCEAVRDGETALIAKTANEWEQSMEKLVCDADMRRRIGREAQRAVLWSFGPENKARLANSLVDLLLGTPEHRASTFVSSVIACSDLPIAVEIPSYEVIYSYGNTISKISVVIPLYNYEKYICEALDSLVLQTLRNFSIVVVNDASTDSSEDVVLKWFSEHRQYFSSLTLLRNTNNSRLSLTRNAGIDYAQSEYIMLLDADNKLLPKCLEKCADILDENATTAAVCPRIKTFGFDTYELSDEQWEPLKFAHGNYIDAMAMIRKAYWSALGGYTRQEQGWEDYDFWCKLVDHGFWGLRTDDILALYRVHEKSMLRTVTDTTESRIQLANIMNSRHRWLRVDLKNSRA